MNLLSTACSGRRSSNLTCSWKGKTAESSRPRQMTVGPGTFMCSEKLRISRPLIAFFLLLLNWQVWGGTLGLVSQRAPNSPPTPTASGASLAPVLSADGRYVLFASDAFYRISSNPAPSQAALGAMNMYLRDRVTRQTSLVTVN